MEEVKSERAMKAMKDIAELNGWLKHVEGFYEKEKDLVGDLIADGWGEYDTSYKLAIRLVAKGEFERYHIKQLEVLKELTGVSEKDYEPANGSGGLDSGKIFEDYSEKVATAICERLSRIVYAKYYI